MEVKCIEVCQSHTGPNHGKMMVLRFTHEWLTPSAVPLPEGMIRPLSLLAMCGWSPRHLGVWDLETGEGAFFLPGGSAQADLEKHRIWVCPMFPSFLAWLYEQDLRDLDALPSYVELPDAPFALAGYRRKGRRR